MAFPTRDSANLDDEAWDPEELESEPADSSGGERIELGAIAAIAFPILAVVLALVTYLPGGAIGREARALLGYTFGWASLLAPIVVGALGAISVRARLEEGYQVSRREAAGWIVEFVAITWLLQVIDGAPVPQRETMRGGGYLGWLGWSTLEHELGAASGVVLVLLLAGLGLTLLLRLGVRDLWAGATRAGSALPVAARRLAARLRRYRAVGFPPPSRARVFSVEEFLQSSDDGRKSAAEGHPTDPAEPPDPDAPPEWVLPSVAMLTAGGAGELSEAELERKIRTIEETLADFDVYARVVKVNPGPTITQFGLEPGFRERHDRGGAVTRREKIKVSEITNLTNDLALALAAPSLRIEAPVPGQQVVGLEVPNNQSVVVNLRQVVESNAFQKLAGKTRLALALGEDVSGQPVAADLAKMPHLLIAGATGSGKSICINAIISCLLLQATPDEVRLILVDPKRVELTSYNNVPHLLRPVVVDADRVVSVLKWVVKEMDDRYRQFEALGVRNLDGYNKLADGPDGPPPLPFIVVIIDELADLMMLAPEETERLLCRLAQLARATGIHLVVATQRPSVDVITGLIKANFPTRISFAVTSQIDSRTILDSVGAEKLLGKGDMLFMPTDAAKPIRLQGVYVSDEEIEALVHHWQALGPPSYVEDLVQAPSLNDSGGDDADDDLYARAATVAREHTRISISLLQRRLRVGYTRAARLIDQLEQDGIVGPPEPGGRSREVLHRPVE